MRIRYDGGGVTNSMISFLVQIIFFFFLYVCVWFKLKNKTIVRPPVPMEVVVVEDLPEGYISGGRSGFEKFYVYLDKEATCKELHHLVSKNSQKEIDQMSQKGQTRHFYEAKMEIVKITFKGEDVRCDGHFKIESGDGYKVFFKTIYKPKGKDPCVIL